MWLYLVMFVVVAIALIGGLLAGGIFTIIFIPLAAIIAVVVFAMYVSGRWSKGRMRMPSEQHPMPTPDHPGGGTAPASRQTAPPEPGTLADARRREQ